MKSTYFLVANSKDGFISLYDGFCRGEGDYLTVIKGGPGTGKSAFMRAIGEAAEARGMATEYILCSGDPDSLDGVYIPAMRRGWVDGTAPHITEPRRFGVDGDYVNLGQFCAAPLPPRAAQAAAGLYEAYRAEYGRAYAYLAAAEALRRAYLPQLFQGELLDSLRRRMRNILKRGRVRGAQGGGTQRRFLSAISCKGEICLSGEVEKLCKLIYVLEDSLGGAAAALELAREEGDALRAAMLACPSPIDGTALEALIFPEWGIGLVREGFGISEGRRLHLNAAIEPARLAPYRDALGAGQEEYARLVSRAVESLKGAKALHDALEAQYRPQMDFAALTEFRAEYIRDVF